MTAYITRRLILGVLVLFLVTILVFLVMRLLPGDPLTLFISQSQMSSGQLTVEQMNELRHEYGLDKTLVMQYVDWIKGIFQGNLGKSIFYATEVKTLISERMPITLYLGALAFIFSAILGIFFGIICAVRRGSWIDSAVTVLANVGITVPSFWFGILLIYFFSLILHWLPTGGFISPFSDFVRKREKSHHAGFLPLAFFYCIANQTDPVQCSGNCQAGFYPHCLGKRFERTGHNIQTYHKKRLDSGHNHIGCAGKYDFRWLGTYRNGLQYSGHGPAFDTISFSTRLSGRPGRSLNYRRSGGFIKLNCGYLLRVV